MTNILAIQKIRARLAQLGSHLRISYSVAQQPQNAQTLRDGAVLEVVHLYKRIRRSERMLDLLVTEDRAAKVARRAVRADATGSCPVVVAPLPALAI